MRTEQDMCPICTEPFKKEEVLVRYVTWDEKQHAEKLGHLDCVLYLSKIEQRKHPPTSSEVETRITVLEKNHSSAVANLARRIANLGG